MGTKNVLRRDFLGLLATGTAALGVGQLATAGLTKAHAAPILQSTSDQGFESWLGKINGKHKQVFDAPRVNHGYPLAWARVFLSTNNGVGVPDADCSAVVVLRHDAIPLAMGSGLWEKYGFGEMFEVMNPETKKPLSAHPFYKTPPGTLPFDDMTIDGLQARGAMFAVCDMALTFYSMKVGKAKGMEAADIKKDWVSGILPGIQIVPSGVLAINRAQERGCSYVYAG